MEQLMITLAAMLPAEKIAEDIKDAAQDFLLFPEEEKLKRLVFECHMLLLHARTGGTIEGANKAIKDLESMEAKLKLFEDTAAN